MKPALVAAAIAAASFGMACSGSSPSGPSGGTTTTGSTTTGGTTTGGTTITITSSGANPRSITVPVGSTVTFVNNDNTPHDMSSDPHPQHTDCPEVNNAGFIQPGQSRSTTALRTARTCGFHDHNQPSNTALQGTIVIQ